MVSIGYSSLKACYELYILFLEVMLQPPSFPKI